MPTCTLYLTLLHIPLWGRREGVICGDYRVIIQVIYLLAIAVLQGYPIKCDFLVVLMNKPNALQLEIRHWPSFP